MSRRVAKGNLSAVKDWAPTDSPAAREFMVADLRRSGLLPSDLSVEPCEFGQFPGIPAYVIHYGATGYWRVRLGLDPAAAELRGKYRGPHKEDARVRTYVPFRSSEAQVRRATVKYITEGEKKAEKLFKDLEVPVLGIAGCWSWAARSGTSDRVLLPSLQAVLKPEDTVFYVADRDILDPLKLDIGKAAKALQMKLASLNVKCQVLVPPAPFKGVDDWLVGGEPPFVMDGLEEFQFSWFPVAALIDEGVTFRPDKDGNILSHKQAISDLRNTKLLSDLILRGDPFISCDKYVGYQANGRNMSGHEAAMELEASVNQFFPGFAPKKEGVALSLGTYVVGLKQTNIIAEYVKGLAWDGKERLASWLPQTMRLAEGQDAKYATRVGMAMMCGLYQRVIEPGSQCDYMWILQGPQGIGKTTFFRTMGKFPGHDGYAAIAATDLMRMDYTLGRNLKRAVVLDVDDLESVRGKAHGDVKSFVSRTKDVWREIYVSFITEEPRGCVITGSTNDSAILTDMTGSRRFLILSVDDVRGVKGFWAWSTGLRDVLLAECHARWAELGSMWWDISVDEINLANRGHVVPSPLADAIKSMYENDALMMHNGHRVITPSALCTWMADPKWSSPTGVGMAMSRMVGSPVTGVKLLQKHKIRVGPKTFEDMPRQIRALYRPPHDVQMMWVYPVVVDGEK